MNFGVHKKPPSKLNNEWLVNSAIIINGKEINAALIVTKVVSVIVLICFILYAFGWTPQTTLTGDVSSFPGYRVPYKTVKILYQKIDNN